MAVSNSTDRFNGVIASLAVKVPAVRALSSNRASLSGAITVDGHVFQNGERLLLLGQTNPIENGVWDVNTTSEWQRSADFDGNRDVTDNTIIVVDRSTGGALMYVVEGTPPIIIGTDPITFSLFFDPSAADFVNLEAETIIAGDPGTEGGGITVHGVTYNSVLKVSDLGGVNIAQSILHRHSTTLGPLIVGGRSNSNDETHTLVTDGQALLWLVGTGHDGTDYEQAGSIQIDVDGVAADDDMPGRIVFSTTPVGAFTPAERVRISSEGGMYLTEIGGADTSIAGKGQLWVKDDAPNVLMFTDDDGTDFQLGASLVPASTAASTVLRGDGAGEWIEETDFTIDTAGGFQSTHGRFNAGNAAVPDALMTFWDDNDVNIWQVQMSTIATGSRLQIVEVGDAIIMEFNAVYGIGVMNQKTMRFHADNETDYGAIFCPASTAALGRLTISGVGNVDKIELSGASLYFNSIASANEDIASRGQLFSLVGPPTTLWFRDDLGDEFQIGGSGTPSGFSFDTFNFNFDTDIATSDPGTGDIKINNATPSSATSVNISETDADGTSRVNILDRLTDGSIVRFEDASDPSIWYRGIVNVNTDNGTWRNLQVQHGGSSGTLPTNGDPVKVLLQESPYVENPTLKGALYYGEIDLSGAPVNGLKQYHGLRAGIAAGPNVSQLEFWDEGGLRWWVNVNGGAMEWNATDAALTAFRVKSDQFVFEAESSALPNITIDSTNISLSHQNTTDAMVMYIHERATARGSVVDFGQLWVKTETPNILMFTDDAGTDFRLNDSGASANVITAGWSTGSGGSITLAANAPILYTEQADHDTIGANQGQVWVKTGAPNTLWYTDDGANDFQLAGAGNRTIDGQLVINRTGEQLRVFDDAGATDPLDYGSLDHNSDLFAMTAWDDSTSTLFAAISISVLTGQVNLGNATAIISANNDLDMNDNLVDTPRLKDYSIESDAPTVSTNAVTLAYSDGPAFEVDMEPATGTVTITLSGGPPSGTYGQITVKVQQDGATAQTITWAGGTFVWAGGTAHPMNTTLDGITIFAFETWDGGTTWYGAGADYA